MVEGNKFVEYVVDEAKVTALTEDDSSPLAGVVDSQKIVVHEDFCDRIRSLQSPIIITTVRKRNKSLAPLNPQKIITAIKKSFIATAGNYDEVVLQKITAKVLDALSKTFCNCPGAFPTVEQIQDVVEKTLMASQGHAEVARAYILYRQERRFLRQQEVLSRIHSKQLYVVRSSGEKILFESQKVYRYLDQIVDSGLDKVDIVPIVEQVCRQVYEGMPVTEISSLILNICKSKTELHYQYSFLSARVLLKQAKKEVLGRDEIYAEDFREYLHKGVDQRLIEPKLLELFSLETLSQTIDYSRDKLFAYLGLQTLCDRYLIRSRDAKLIELPQWMWMRVSMGASLCEEDPTRSAIEFYQAISSFLYMPSTPTLFNSGTTTPQMSSCYVNVVEDSLEEIFKNYADNAQLSKWAGGIGTDWTGVRGTGSKIKGTNGASGGIIPFIKIYNDVAVAVNQGGKRKGAMAAYLENWHIDVEEFLELRKNTGDDRRRAHDIHTALFISDLFMKRVLDDAEWTLFSPNQVAGLHDAYGSKFVELYEGYEEQYPKAKRVKARDLWKKTLTLLYETGHPWITWKCAINVRNPQSHVGVVHSSNLCTEITLNTSKEETAVCNLASINLANHIEDGQLSEIKIKKTIFTVMRMLDNVIDINFYPTATSRQSNIKNRPVGLGFMGYQDALYKMGIPFDSEENLVFADKSMEMISYYAVLASSYLAQERGKYSTFAGSKWDQGLLPIDTVDLLEKERGVRIEVDREMRMDWSVVRDAIQKYGMRNSNCLAIAPTATIANIVGVVPCQEPVFKNIYFKENLSGNFCVINKYLVDELQRVDQWNVNTLAEMKMANGSIALMEHLSSQVKNLFKDVFEISPKRLVQAAAKRAKWLDQSASTNLFVLSRSGKDIHDLYMLAWKMGLKTTYYLRTIAASHISKAGIGASISQDVKDASNCSIKSKEEDCESCQ